MKRKFFASLSVLLALMLLVACGTPAGNTDTGSPGTGDTGTGSSGSTEQPPGDNQPAPANSVVTLMATHGGNAGAHNDAGWWAEIVRERLGLELEFLNPTHPRDYFAVLRAANDLPDLIATGEFVWVNEMIAANQVLNLDDHRDSLPNIFGTPHFENAISFARENVSNDTGGLYVMTGSIGAQHFLNFDMQLRWDIYQAIGAPPIRTFDDYLPVLKQMMDHYPETDAGQKVWGISLFSDWDDYSMAIAGFMVSFNNGYDAELVNMVMETKIDGSAPPRSILSDNSMYKKALQWFFDANQMGVLDPDSITQNWDTITGKWDEGRVLMSTWPWAVGNFNTASNTDVDDFIGYASVWSDDMIVMNWPDLPVGRAWAISVSSQPDNLEGALKYLDFYYSFEAMDLLHNGPQGVLWDVNADGERYRTDFGFQYFRGEAAEMPGGGRLSAAMEALNFPSITAATMNPASPGQELSSSFWVDVIGASPTKLIEDWRAKNDGQLNMFRKGLTTGQVVKGHPALQMMPAFPENLEMTMQQVANVIKTNSWLAVYAKDQAEFDALWAEMQEDAFSLGKQDIVDWVVENWQVALENAKRFAN